MSPNGQSKLLAMLKKQEGLRLKMYIDDTGHDTIGYGHNLTDDSISLAAASQILSDDVVSVFNDLASRLPWFVTLNEPRQSALASMVFNVGIGGAISFVDTLNALQAGNWQLAANSVLASVAAHQDVNRYKQISQLFLSGEWS